jgi:hypothetical protein
MCPLSVPLRKERAVAKKQDESKSKPKKVQSEKAARPAAPGDAAQAFMAVQALISEVADDALVPINIDIPRAVSTILGSLPSVEPYLPKLRTLPDFDFGAIEKLKDFTFAAWHAHLAASPQTSESQKEQLLTDATPIREDLLVAAEALAHKGLLDKVTVASIRAGAGNLDKANDLVALATLFANGWDRVEGKTTVTWDDVEAAGALGPKLLLALADRPTSLTATDASKARARAFTLMVKGYAELRRGLSFLRWHDGDLDVLAPSLHAGRKRKKGGGTAEEEEKSPVEGGATD